MFDYKQTDINMIYVGHYSVFECHFDSEGFFPIFANISNIETDNILDSEVTVYDTSYTQLCESGHDITSMFSERNLAKLKSILCAEYIRRFGKDGPEPPHYLSYKLHDTIVIYDYDKKTFEGTFDSLIENPSRIYASMSISKDGTKLEGKVKIYECPFLVASDNPEITELPFPAYGRKEIAEILKENYEKHLKGEE